MDSEEYRKAGKQMVDYIISYLTTLRDRDVSPDVQPGYLRQLMNESPPQNGEPWNEIIEDVERLIMPGLTHWQSPHMHAYFPATHSYPALLGDMLADAINAIGFTWAASPACTELEINVMDWLADMLKLPEKFSHKNSKTHGGGVIQTTCSEGTMVSLFAARAEMIKKLKDSTEMTDVNDSVINSRLVAYCSEQAHSSVEKAALISLVRLRHLPTDSNFRLRGEQLKRAVEQDKKNRLIPFFVCATLGTTGCCSFDDLKEIAAVCNKEEMWLHIDAAYAGSSFICPEFRTLLDGVEYAQSFVFNPSKWLLCNFDCTAMWVANSRALHRTFNVDPLYLQHEHSDKAVDFMHWQMPLSRRFRSLKLWFVLRSYGVSGLQSHIRKSVKWAEYFESLVRSDVRFEIPARRYLSLVVLRLRGDNYLSERLLKMVNRDGKIYMVPASLNGTYIIRFTVTSPLTTKSDLDRDWKIIQTAATNVLSDLISTPKPNMSRPQLRRRFTWSYSSDNWDVSLTLSNVSDHPTIVNGSFAALSDWSDLKSTFLKANKLESNDNMESGEKGEGTGLRARRVASLDSALYDRLKMLREVKKLVKCPSFEILNSDSDRSDQSDGSSSEINVSLKVNDENAEKVADEHVLVAKQEVNGEYGVEG